MEITLGVVWGIVFVTAVAFEVMTISFVSIWFAAGALAAFIALQLGANVAVQVVLFVVVSAITILAFRPMFKKWIKGKEPKTNKDAIVGSRAVVEKKVGSDSGRVRVGGISWSARSEDGKTYEIGKELKVKRIDGVKVIVTEL